jgi:acetyl-CoA C-acetyltransferase
VDERLPIIVGTGQVTQRTGAERPLEPVALMEVAARLAEEDAGEGLLRDVDDLRVINVLSWPSQAPARDLARRIDATPASALYCHVGGNTPQWLVNEAAERIHDGSASVVLVAGAEAMHSARRTRSGEGDLGWSPRARPEADIGDGRFGMSPLEMQHGATLPVRIYPLFENALRMAYGRSIEEHQRALGELMAPFAATAAANEHAWFRTPRTADEIATASADNRYIGFPYTKYMNAIMDVDMGGALLLTSVAEARRRGIPEERWVYLWGCGDATDHWFVTERVEYASSPAIRAAGARALAMAGITIEDIACFDIYSCFPSAVQIARDMLGIATGDPRPLTVTGGLPYFGGPGNNYVTHSIAAMVQRLRARPEEIGLVTANGWYITKHSVGIYSARPPQTEWHRSDPAIDQAAIDAEPHPPLEESPSGQATVETHTVIFDRDGAPELGIVIGRTAGGSRFIANTPADRPLLESMTQREVIGERGRVSQAEDGRNVFTF